MDSSVARSTEHHEFYPAGSFSAECRKVLGERSIRDTAETSGRLNAFRDRMARLFQNNGEVDVDEFNRLRRNDLSAKPDLSHIDLEKKIMPNIDFSDARLNGARLAGANLNYAYLTNADCQGANFENALLQAAELWETDLRGARLSGAHLDGAELLDARLDHSDLSHASLQSTELKNVSFKGAILDGTDFRYAKSLTAQQLAEANSFDRAIFSEMQQPIVEAARQLKTKLHEATRTNAAPAERVIEARAA